MFIGHYAPALIVAAHPRAQRLGSLFLAAQLVDVAFFGFVLAGVERMRAVPGTTAMNAMDLYHMPYTHSLIGSGCFALAWAAVTYLVRRDALAAALGGVVVVSHWFLDLLVHPPDLTLAGGAARYGFALWNYPAIEMPLELAMTSGAFGYYLLRTVPRSSRAWIAPALLFAALLLVQAINWTTPQPAEIIDPVPASESLTALAAFAVLTALAAWTGRSRLPRVGPRVRTL
ncbi:hypothetical protein [Sphingomonas sp. TZW2008]|uniref:hypothetical protein n=1 Tax=Sphingomonas sp. TZW2008 TaxID=1917973 RepID=UPI000A26AC2A|nr:hypothetical protein [Sphingomonas sp. TZW2008]